jgi:hypothetical protein
VPWERAPAAFAAVCGDGDAEIEMTTSLFRSAMESLLDDGEIHVERLDGGGNRLVAAAREGDEVVTRRTSDVHPETSISNRSNFDQ